MGNKHLIVIAGPTASGKTDLSVKLAQQLNAPIISADSRQCYKELSIGTAKPLPKEMKNIPHYFIDSHSVKEPLTSGQFEKEATSLIDKLFKENQTILVVGGSGMFINALIYGTDNFPHNKNVREHLNKTHNTKGITFLQQQLKKKDPVYFDKVDQLNPVRLIRALEIIEITGKPFSQLRKKSYKALRYPTSYFVIDYPRELLYQRINLRVDKMVSNGLVNEAKINQHHRHLQPLNTIGYKEIFSYLDGEISLERSVELIKRNTRRYAKRQLTWFRQDQNCIWINALDFSKMMAIILSSNENR